MKLNLKLNTTRALTAVSAGATAALLAGAGLARASSAVGNIGWMSANRTGVMCVQIDLAENGYYSGRVDGAYGSGTEAGVKALQHSLGLSRDGIVGKDTGSAVLNDLKGLLGSYTVTLPNGSRADCWKYVPSHS
ncbi:peptidoglycan-binding domain-containing protein [Streptomyces sp. NPDC052000]|uniref:peptidoglycan-binding domain-containing protein n=1 Tax=Streptomyces sp. NPDC052000 TaxID=3155676 RepID=UPI00344C9763